MDNSPNALPDTLCQAKPKARIAAHNEAVLATSDTDVMFTMGTTGSDQLSSPPMDAADIANPDILESRFSPDILQALLRDQSSGRNILWATDDYAHRGKGYRAQDTIEVPLITGANEGLIKPRSEKAKAVRLARIREKAEVFTPSWVCNRQNNLIDEAWFGRKDVFNLENDDHTWTTNTNKIAFPDTLGKTWRDYVRDVRMEVTCGEAPYLTSRYDTVTGDYIEPMHRIGILDRKFRIVYENNGTDRDPRKWYKWMKIALQSVYGYEWQGDSLLLARENILSSYVRWYMLRFEKCTFPPTKYLLEVIEIITWNIWQMDGLKGVVPNSCVPAPDIDTQLSLFPVEQPTSPPCPACLSGSLRDMPRHTGIHCRIRDWDLPHDGKSKRTIYFYKTLKLK